MGGARAGSDGSDVVTRTATVRRRLLAPEILQGSAMDCGPAALACLLGGFGIPADLGRLREACQTDVDGTSIDAVEELAIELGLDAEQVMVPVDHIPLASAGAVPAVLVVDTPSGGLHFVVIWRRHGGFAQVMDPQIGRRWIGWRELLGRAHRHRLGVSAQAWREWAGSSDSLGPLQERIVRLGCTRRFAASAIERAAADPGWRGLARLDAAVRMVADGLENRQLGRGVEARRLLEHLTAPTTSDDAIPEGYWSVRAVADAGDRLWLEGAVLVRVRGHRPEGAPTSDRARPDLERARHAAGPGPLRALARLLVADGVRPLVLIAVALAVAAGAVVIEALLLRTLLELSVVLRPPPQRLVGVAAVLAFLAGMAMLEPPVTAALLAAGRRLETGLRVAWLTKLPLLGERYMRTRPAADMAERVHGLHHLRSLPLLAGRALEVALQLLLTAGALIWLDPAGAPLVVLAAAAALVVPIVGLPLLGERELRVRVHSAALIGLALDALRGSTTIRVHNGHAAIVREHEDRLAGWRGARLELVDLGWGLELGHLLLAFAASGWLVVDHLGRRGATPAVLLLVYWALRLPVLAEVFGRYLRELPLYRSIATRVLEPLGAPEEELGDASRHTIAASEQARTSGVEAWFEGVTVHAAGREILHGVELRLEAGTALALVGPSGAGKSTLLGLLLGRHRPSSGRLSVDGQAIDGRVVAELRRETAWVDPEARLWDRSLLANLYYGAEPGATRPLADVLEAAGLDRWLAGFREGLQTRVGDGGSLLSGTEGSAARLGRALVRERVRLVLVDEALRGLDRNLRRTLLGRLRSWWPDATLIAVTHDLDELDLFDRVAVLEEGRLVEDGSVAGLAARPGSRLAAMLEASVDVTETTWQRLALDGGRLVPDRGPA